MEPHIDVEISYSLGMEPSDVGSEPFGGGGGGVAVGVGVQFFHNPNTTFYKFLFYFQTKVIRTE